MKVEKTERIVFVTTGLLLWLYLIARAWTVPIVHDEAATFFHYIEQGRFLPYHAHWDANNHFLNSALSIAFHQLFGTETFVLRMANLLFFPVYILYAFKLGNLCSTRWIKYLVWITLLFPHNLIEYFGYSRGYGMSIALMLGMIYYSISFVREMNIKSLVWSMVYMFLMLTASLTLTNTAILICTGIFLSILLFPTNNRRQYIQTLFLLGGCNLLFAAWISFELKRRGLLYYGEGKNFWTVTVRSVSELVSGETSGIAEWIALAIFLLFIFLFISVIKRFGKSVLRDPGFLISMLLLGNILSTLGLHYLFGVNFPEDRTGMYFYYFLALSTCLLADRMSTINSRRAWGASIWLLLPFHFLTQINLQHATYWWYEHYNSSIYNRLKAEAKGREFEVGIGGYRIHRLVWGFYNVQNNGALNAMQTADFPMPEYDYLLYPEEHVHSEEIKSNYEILEIDPVSGLHLLRRKHPHRKKFWMTVNGHGKTNSKDEFFNLWQAELDTISSNSLFLDIRMNLSTPLQPLHSDIVAAISDSAGQNIYYETISTDWVREKWEIGSEFHYGLYLYRIPEAGKKLTVYFWNIQKAEFSLENFEVRVSTIQPEN